MIKTANILERASTTSDEAQSRRKYRNKLSPKQPQWPSPRLQASTPTDMGFMFAGMPRSSSSPIKSPHTAASRDGDSLSTSRGETPALASASFGLKELPPLQLDATDASLPGHNGAAPILKISLETPPSSPSLPASKPYIAPTEGRPGRTGIASLGASSQGTQDEKGLTELQSSLVDRINKDSMDFRRRGARKPNHGDTAGEDGVDRSCVSTGLDGLQRRMWVPSELPTNYQQESALSSSSSPSERSIEPRRRHVIAMVSDFFFPRLGGGEMHIWSLSQCLQAMGHKVVVITHAYGDRVGIRTMTNGLKVYYFPVSPVYDGDTFPDFFQNFCLFRNVLLREGVTVVHGHQATSNMMHVFLLQARTMGYRTVYTDHSLWGFRDAASINVNKILKFTLSDVDHAIAVSHTCKENLVMRTSVSADAVSAIPNAVDPTRFTPDLDRRPGGGIGIDAGPADGTANRTQDSSLVTPGDGDVAGDGGPDSSLRQTKCSLGQDPQGICTNSESKVCSGRGAGNGIERNWNPGPEAGAMTRLRGVRNSGSGAQMPSLPLYARQRNVASFGSSASNESDFFMEEGGAETGTDTGAADRSSSTGTGTGARGASIKGPGLESLKGSSPADEKGGVNGDGVETRRSTGPRHRRRRRLSRRGLGGQSQPVVNIVMLSRLVYRKGIDLAIKVIPRVCRRFPHVRFIIGGDGDKRILLEEMKERHQLHGRVKILGMVPHRDVRNTLVKGHIFFNCSLTESFCIALLEAASCGLVVVSTAVGGVPEVLPKSMIHLAEPNADALTRELSVAVGYARRVNPMWVHRAIRQMYSWQDVARRTVEVYDEVAAAPPLSLADRLRRYMTNGRVFGPVAVLLVVLLHLVWVVLEWWSPPHLIEVAVEAPLPPPAPSRPQPGEGMDWQSLLARARGQDGAAREVREQHPES